MQPKKNYETPAVISREDLKEITLYTGFDPSGRGSRQGRKLFWHMP